MEAFVNQVHDYSSSTNYLIWCNLYTTTVNIFKGYKGHWELIMTGECTIGTPTTPTRIGSYTLYSRAYYWSFDSGSIKDVTRCYYASLFDGGIAFHTRLYYTGTSTYASPNLSLEQSHGCVRCPDDIAKFIYYQCPLGTKVIVY
jgi:lipoprotein-anchoring transpeptidase ErfK/SrfK